MLVTQAAERGKLRRLRRTKRGNEARRSGTARKALGATAQIQPAVPVRTTPEQRKGKKGRQRRKHTWPGRK